ncbi:hypothetical protein [Streptomyces sp. NPDC018352]|uniref:hypothetical protein n=1 Tax=Streptomyces sp. NPDC018352 TaxID=3157194 RepID=UPI0033CA8352
MRVEHGPLLFLNLAAGELTLGFAAFIPPGVPRQALDLYCIGPGSPFEAALSTF